MLHRRPRGVDIVHKENALSRQNPLSGSADEKGAVQIFPPLTGVQPAHGHRRPHAQQAVASALRSRAPAQEFSQQSRLIVAPFLFLRRIHRHRNYYIKFTAHRGNFIKNNFRKLSRQVALASVLEVAENFPLCLPVLDARNSPVEAALPIRTFSADVPRIPVLQKLSADPAELPVGPSDLLKTVLAQRIQLSGTDGLPAGDTVNIGRKDEICQPLRRLFQQQKKTIGSGFWRSGFRRSGVVFSSLPVPFSIPSFFRFLFLAFSCSIISNPQLISP